MKNVHPVSGAGIRTRNFLLVNLLPLPLEQGSCKIKFSIKNVSLKQLTQSRKCTVSAKHQRWHLLNAKFTETWRLSFTVIGLYEVIKTALDFLRGTRKQKSPWMSASLGISRSAVWRPSISASYYEKKILFLTWQHFVFILSSENILRFLQKFIILSECKLNIQQ